MSDMWKIFRIIISLYFISNRLEEILQITNDNVRRKMMASSLRCFSFSPMIISITLILVVCVNFSSAGSSPSGEDIQKCKKESRIEEPADKSNGEGYPLVVKGNAANCPVGYHFWIIVHPVSSAGYWPQGGEVFPSPRDNSYEAKVWLGEAKKGINEQFQIILAIANEEAHKSFVKYISDGPKHGYPEKPMPSGVMQIDRITYTRTK
jgi:hypothetical protein